MTAPGTLEPSVWAERLGVSVEAAQLVADCEVLDLHLDTFIWTRLFGYEIRKRHGQVLRLCSVAVPPAAPPDPLTLACA